VRSRVLLATFLIALASCAFAAANQSAQPQVVPAAGIRFIAEQNGQFENTVKERIAAALPEHAEVQRAYLVSALYPDATTGVVLGVACNGPPSQAVLSDIQRAFAAVAPSNLSLDVMFLSPKQQTQVALVAKPFYIRP
jgi:hypothetical protein